MVDSMSASTSSLVRKVQVRKSPSTQDPGKSSHEFSRSFREQFSPPRGLGLAPTQTVQTGPGLTSPSGISSEAKVAELKEAKMKLSQRQVSWREVLLRLRMLNRFLKFE